MSPSVEPFNEKKYNALMDGLECRELSLQYVLAQSSGGRIDSHFFEKKYKKVIEVVNRQHSILLKDAVSREIQTGHTPSMKNNSYYGGNIALIKTDNLREGKITLPFSHYLSEQGNQTVKRTALEEGDVITTIIGANEKVIARSALVTREELPANINQNIVRIRINRNICSPEYLSVYLNTKYGKGYLYYYSRQMEQFNLNCEEVGLVRIPLFSKSFIDLVSDLVLKKESTLREANALYKMAETELVSGLGIQEFTPSLKQISVKGFAESFSSTGRLDAEYYQPKYEQIEALLATPETVSTVCNIYDKNYEPDKKKQYLYIELSNIGLYGEINGVEETDGFDLPTRARRLVRKGQVIVSSIEGSLDSCAIISEEYDNALCSTGFYVVDSERINSETLLVLFKSQIIQALLKQRCSGTILTNIAKEAFLSMPLPEVEEKLQRKTADKVRESFALRRKSEQLFERARQAVEIAIERGEAAAINWLEAE